MATTSIWPIKESSDKVIAYVENPEKTTEKKQSESASTPAGMQAASETDRVIAYAENPEKTTVVTNSFFTSGAVRLAAANGGEL